MSSIKMIRSVSNVSVSIGAAAVSAAGASRSASAACRTPLGTGTGILGRARTMASKAVTLDNINPNIVKLEYAVRGPLVIRAAEIQRELKEGKAKPFKRVIQANIGDAHAMGQVPITYIRQVLACMVMPELIESGGYPEDVRARARELLGVCGGGSVGAYTASHGIELVRRHVAEFIARRDGHPSNWQNVCLSSGASNAIKNVLQLFCNKVGGKPSGVMIPIPQYPLYSASLAEYGLQDVGYYLVEEANWGLDIAELERALGDASAKCQVRAIVVINPGNPTGQVLTRENIEQIIKFAHKHKLFIFADEVYQDNVYAKGSKFFSFKKVMVEMGPPYDQLELASFMSVSKGYMGECGLRGGWMELCNIEPAVQANLFKCISAMLCPTTLGQTTVDCVAKPPAEGEPSYELWRKEKQAVLDSLDKRATMIAKSFNSMEGFSCNVVQGAMYAFPSFKLPPKAVAAAEKAGQKPDVFYAFKLLEESVRMARLLLLAEAEEQRLKKMLSLHRRQLREYSMPMLLPERTFVENFRLSKDNFMRLYEDVMPFLHPSQRTSAIKPEIKILAALNYYATGSYQKPVGNDFSLALSQTSVSDCLAEVTDALNQPQILRKYISFPKSANERNAVARRFNDQFGFPGVLGCIDGTHVAIIRPKDYEEAFFNRKLYHSLNVLVICDANLRILHVDASVGGASHDSHIWNLCPLKAGMQRLHEMGQIFWFLGDSGYAQRPWMMTPILNAPAGSPEEHYTNRHVRTRNVVERCFGILKTRFRCLLAHRTMHYTPEKAGKMVNACVVLHNLIFDSRIEIDEEAMRRDRERQPPRAPFRPLAPADGGGGRGRGACPTRQAVVNRLWNARF